MVGTSGQAARRGAITASGERAAGHVRQHHVAVDHQQLDHAAQAVGQRSGCCRDTARAASWCRSARSAPTCRCGPRCPTRRAVVARRPDATWRFDQAGEVLHRQRLVATMATGATATLASGVVPAGRSWLGMRVDRQRAGGRGQQGGAAGWGHHAHRGASARLFSTMTVMFDSLRSTSPRSRPPDRVGAAAGGVGHDQRDGLGGPILGHCAACHDCQGRPRGLDQQCLFSYLPDDVA